MTGDELQSVADAKDGDIKREYCRVILAGTTCCAVVDAAWTPTDDESSGIGRGEEGGIEIERMKGKPLACQITPTCIPLLPVDVLECPVARSLSLLKALVHADQSPRQQTQGTDAGTCGYTPSVLETSTAQCQAQPSAHI